MKLRLIIDLDVPDDLGQQVCHSGLAVVKSGTLNRIRVGSKLLAYDQAHIVMKLEDDDGVVTKDREKRQIGQGRSD